MRIIIELDGNSQPEIRKISSGEGEQPGNYPTSSAPLDAGFANIPKPESYLSPGSEIAETGTSAVSKEDSITGIDAGGFNANPSEPDSDMAVSSHLGQLASAVSSGLAMDAGIANIPGADFNSDELSSQDSGGIIFDRTQAINAGAFVNSETADII